MSYVVAATWVAREGEQEAVAAAIEKLAQASRAEPGNLLYQPHRDPDDPRVFFIYEQYVDAAASEAHRTSAHFAAHGLDDAIPRLERRERSVFETFG